MVVAQGLVAKRNGGDQCIVVGGRGSTPLDA